MVTLRVRVWIETSMNHSSFTVVDVTLRVRVWIETSMNHSSFTVVDVTLRVRVWIETLWSSSCMMADLRHPPREGVD